MRSFNTSRKITIILLSISLFAASSCEKFLDERPSKNSSLPVETVAHLNAILERYAVYYSDENQSWMHTDDYGLTKTLYDARPGVFSFLPTIFHTFNEVTYLPTTTSGDYLWGSTSGEWRDIFYANSVLVNVDKVDGTDAEKRRIKADAHLIRAYAYWQLANTYCLPYTEKNKSEMGLPIKKSTSFEEDLTRKSLEETYNFIESDLQEALKINKPLVVSGRPEHWRANTAAVNGFAARYYLNRNNYAEALKYANLALGEYSVLNDYNLPSVMSYGTNQNITINAGTPAQSVFTLRYPYGHNNQTNLVDMIGWKEFLYFRMLNFGSWWYVPSQALLDSYDKTNDLRYEYHIVEGYSYERGMNSSPAYNYPGYVFFYKDRIPSGPTTAEMYLIKAECLARAGDVSGALASVNILRAKRMKPGPWVNLTAANQADAVSKILQERRREMPFTQRFYDIRRYNNNADPADDVVVSKQFYPLTQAGANVSGPLQNYTLTKDSRLWALPLPFSEILSSQGKLEQNKY
jgi:hypothetical protein